MRVRMYLSMFVCARVCVCPYLRMYICAFSAFAWYTRMQAYNIGVQTTCAHSTISAHDAFLFIHVLHGKR